MFFERFWPLGASAHVFMVAQAHLASSESDGAVAPASTWTVQAIFADSNSHQQPMESSQEVCCLDIAAPETSQATIVSNLCAYAEEKTLELSIQRLRAT